MTARRYIKPGTRIPLRLSVPERDLVVARAFLDPEMESRLRGAALAGTRLVVDLTLDDIDELAGCVAAEANHCKDARVRRVLDGVFERLKNIEDRFTDEAPLPPRLALVTVDASRGFTAKQGQYLAFIYYFTKIHGVSPAESDFQKFFKVSPPAVHEMILALERRGLIERTVGKPRSVRLRVARANLPDLE
jgi:repressor LexA